MPNGHATTMKLPSARPREARIDSRRLSGPVRPLLSALAVVAVSAALVGTILVTRLNAEWITFLAGILVAALLAEATRVSRAEWSLMRRTAQLSAAKDKLEREARARKMAEQVLASAKPRLHLVDELLPTMIVLVDADGRCRYHNHAFRDGLHVRAEQVDGLHLNEVLGAKVYQEIAAYVRQALDGQTVKYERVQKTPDGAVNRLAVSHVPQYAEGGRVAGFYMLTDALGTPNAAAAHAPGATLHADAYAHPAAAHQGREDQTAAEIVRAIEKNEFRLFSQRIAPLGANTGRAEFHEVLVRLMEEEEGLIPPGAFFPLAEKYGMMPHLDRWVVRHVAEWIAMQVQQSIWPEGSVYFINLSDDSIQDPGFADFLEVTLAEYGISGKAMCFEVPNDDLVAHSAAVAAFAKAVQQCGARVALSGFGNHGAGFDKIRGYTPDFLKIDGSTLLAIQSDAAALARVKTITETAKKVECRTIAEMVESEEVLATLREIGVDFAQGFGISRPHPLAGRAGEKAAPAPAARDLAGIAQGA